MADTTSFDYFSIPMTLQVYKGGTSGTLVGQMNSSPVSTVLNAVSSLSGGQAVIDNPNNGDSFVRVLGPSVYPNPPNSPINPASPYQSFTPYLNYLQTYAAAHGGVVATIAGNFNGVDGMTTDETKAQSYNFTVSIDSHDDLTLTGSGGIIGGHSLEFMYQDLINPSGIYGANAPFYLDGSPTSTYPQNDIYGWITGDLLAGLNVGALGSTTVVNGVEVGQMPSQQWFSLTSYFSALQPNNPDYYNQYAAAMSTVSDAYNFAYTDRFAHVTVPLDPARVDTLVINIGGLLTPEPGSATILIVGAAVLLTAQGVRRCAAAARTLRPRRHHPMPATPSAGVRLSRASFDGPAMTTHSTTEPEKVGQPYRSWHGGGRFNAIVIGSGIGGLTTAALLARRAGRRVLVVERHYVVGGYTHVFKRPGYEWDVGLHYVGEFHRPGSTLARLFAAVSDGQVDWAPTGDVYDRIVIAGEAYDFVTGRERFAARLKASFPREAAAIDRYLKLVESCVRASRLYYAEKAIPAPLAFVAGRLLRWPFLRYARRTTADVLGGLTENRQLIGVLTGQWGDFGLPPGQSSFGIQATIADHYLEGASYPAGGASRIAAAIVPVIERAGGTVLFNAQVDQIAVEGDRTVGVRMADGRLIEADRVISGAGAGNTFGRLLPAGVAERFRLAERLRSVGPSLAHINLYVGLRHSDAELGLSTTNLWIYPTPNHDQNLAAYLADPAAPFPFVYISFPSAKDPTFQSRYPGRATLQLIAPARYDWFRQWEDEPWRRRGETYEQLKQSLAERLLEVLYRHVPRLRGLVDHAELSTPLSTRHFAGYIQGEPYGLAHTPARFDARWLQPRTPIRNLYLTGQDIAVCGIAGGLVSGR